MSRASAQAPVRVLVADPPWLFKDQLPGRGRGAAKHYSLMAVGDIATYPLPSLSESAVLFLWRVAAMVEEAYAVARAWGFVPKAELVWCKVTKDGRPRIGMGHYVRGAHETCIIAVRGSCTSADRSVPSVFHARRPREHSAKPDEFFEIVEQLYPDGPRCELFARKRRPGWLQFGLELEATA